MIDTRERRPRWITSPTIGPVILIAFILFGSVRFLQNQLWTNHEPIQEADVLQEADLLKGHSLKGSGFGRVDQEPTAALEEDEDEEEEDDSSLPEYTIVASALKPIAERRGAEEKYLPDAKEFSSPNGNYILRFTPTNGTLEYVEKTKFADKDGQRTIFTAHSGDAKARDHALFLTDDGLLIIQAGSGNGEWPDIRWHSWMLGRCVQNLNTEGPSAMTIANTGELQIRKGAQGDGDVLCAIYSPNRSQEPEGRLALVITGLYRNNNELCNTHVKRVVKTWPGEAVDVFVYTYYENADEKAAMTNAITSCYGSNLRALQIEDLHAAEEPFPLQGVEDHQCGYKNSRLYSQLKTNFRGVQLLYHHMMKSGTDYEYILKIRTDTNIFKDLPRWKKMPDDTILMPHPTPDSWPHPYFYCPTHFGDVGVGPTDQVAYGQKAPMLVWFDMFVHFRQLVLDGQRDRAWRDWSACFIPPSGPMAADCPNGEIDICAIECHLYYWLHMRGIKPELAIDFYHHKGDFPDP